MIHAKIKYPPRCIVPHSGHILLLLWVEHNKEKKELFLHLIRHSETLFDLRLFTTILNSAATHCLNEYMASSSILKENETIDDLFSWYNEIKQDYTN